MKVNPITTEVIRSALLSIAEEMQVTLVKTARSLIVKETGDCSCALHDVQGRQIAQASALPIHLGMIVGATEAMLRKYPPDKMAEGDILIMNGPYRGGTHYNDIYIMEAISYGGEMVGFSVNVAHHQDVGGMTPGSMPANATEVYQEGISIPISKLYQAGQPDETLIEMIRANVRNADVLWGDIEAQIAAAKIGTRRVKTLIDKYGLETVRASMDDLLRYSEMRARAEIEAIPDGTYEGIEYLDNDGVDLDKHVKIKVVVKVEGSDITFDFTGTDAQTRGPANMDVSSTLATVTYTMRGVMDPDIPRNSGAAVPFRVVMPEGSLINPRPPAPVNARGRTSGAVAKAILIALSRVIPNKITAGTFAGPDILLMGGIAPDTGEYFIVLDGFGGGAGARVNKDGISGKDTFCSNCLGTPVEALELDYPFMIEHYGLLQDSGGPGKFRGGLGVRRNLRIMVDEGVMTSQADGIDLPPRGLFGGKNGHKGKHILYTGEKERVLPGKCSAITVGQGDQLVRCTAGGGGYGDPLERDPLFVHKDVINKRVSLEGATRDYGVVLDPKTFEINYEATVKLRKEVK